MTVENARRAVLAAMLPLVPFDGWTQRTLNAAVRECGFETVMGDIAFPRGAIDAICLHTQLADEETATYLSSLTAEQRLPDRLKAAIIWRLRRSQSEREAIRKALAILALPTNAATGAKLLYATIDSLWYAAGDRSTDFNFYTKRATLAGVYSATLLAWLEDDSPNQQDTVAFLDRRLAGVARFGKRKKEMQSKLQRWNPRPAFARFS